LLLALAYVDIAAEARPVSCDPSPMNAEAEIEFDAVILPVTSNPSVNSTYPSI
jgi:hypothetical protein